MFLRPRPSASALLIATLVAITTPSRAADYADDALQGGRIVEFSDGQRLRSSGVREGDRLHTGWNDRLVVEVGPNRLKLDEKTDLVVRRLDPDGVELDLERGSLVLEVRRPASAWRWQVDTATARHQPQGAGLFRIDAPDRRRGSDTGSATAWRSALRIENEDGALLLPPGQRAERDRHGRWQLGYPEADAFAAWAMGGPNDRDLPDERRPRHWQAAPSWEVQPPPPPPPRVIVVPAPIIVEPPPRHWRAEPEPRDQRPPRLSAPVPIPAPAQPVRPMPTPMPDPAPSRPDRRHHETSPASPVTPPAGPASSPAMPRQDEPRRSQRML